MNKIFEILALISWILCFSYEIIYILKNYNSKEYFKDFKNKALKVIRFDKLLLIIIFIVYVRFNKEFITSLVFTVICLYLYINKLYEKSKKDSLSNVLSKNSLTLFIILLLSIIPFVLIKHMDNTYIILLFYIFLSYFIVGLSKKISKLFKTKKKR